MTPRITRRRALRWIVFGTGGFLIAAQQRATASDKNSGHQDGYFSDSVKQRLSKVSELGINPLLFVALWRAAFDQHDSVGGAREEEFCQGFADVVLESSSALQEELALVSGVLESGFGRLALTGRWASVTSDSASDLRQRFQYMAASWFPFRRKALMGILVIIGMSHFSREALQSDSGYPGVPNHVKSIWWSAEDAEAKGELRAPRAMESGK